MRRCVEFLRGEVAWLCRQFDRLDIKYWKPATNFIMFETRLPAEDLNQQLSRARLPAADADAKQSCHTGIRVSAEHAGGPIKPSFAQLEEILKRGNILRSAALARSDPARHDIAGYCRNAQIAVNRASHYR